MGVEELLDFKKFEPEIDLSEIVYNDSHVVYLDDCALELLVYDDIMPGLTAFRLAKSDDSHDISVYVPMDRRSEFLEKVKSEDSDYKSILKYRTCKGGSFRIVESDEVDKYVLDLNHNIRNSLSTLGLMVSRVIKKSDGKLDEYTTINDNILEVEKENNKYLGSGAKGETLAKKDYTLAISKTFGCVKKIKDSLKNMIEDDFLPINYKEPLTKEYGKISDYISKVN